MGFYPYFFPPNGKVEIFIAISLFFSLPSGQDFSVFRSKLLLQADIELFERPGGMFIRRMVAQYLLRFSNAEKLLCNGRLLLNAGIESPVSFGNFT